jgi:lipoprotein-anchoring transpeptidase ErfK/SrfK
MSAIHFRSRRRFYDPDNLRAWLLPGLIGAAALILILAPLLYFLARSPGESPAQVPPEVARLDLKDLSKQVDLLEGKVQKLVERRNRLFPPGPAILVDTAANRIYMVQGSKVLVQDKCSTGSGLELTDTSGNRSWTFETPRGYFKVLGKVTDPVWIRPDWAFIEEGEAIPKDRASREVPDVLGDYALAFGDGYFIHGTLYTRMLGSSVTHGCIRVDDESLKKIYQTAQHGTPIWVY